MITRPLNQLDLTTDVNYSIEKVPVVKNTHLSSDPTHYPTNQIIQNKVIRLKNSPAFKLTFIKRQVNPNTKAARETFISIMSPVTCALTSKMIKLKSKPGTKPKNDKISDSEMTSDRK